MNKRHHRYIKRRFIIREQLTGYGPASDQEIRYIILPGYRQNYCRR